MKTYALLIPKHILMPIAVIGLIAGIFGALMKITHWEMDANVMKIILIVSIVFTLTAIFVVLLDIIRNPILNKFLWFVPLLFFGNIVAIVYLLVRDAHLRKAIKSRQ